MLHRAEETYCEIIFLVTQYDVTSWLVEGHCQKYFFQCFTISDYKIHEAIVKIELAAGGV